MNIELTPEQAHTEKNLGLFVSSSYYHAVVKFSEVPTSGNFAELTEAMLVMQAWYQRRTISNAHSYDTWLDDMSKQPASGPLNELIFQRAHGDKHGTLAQVLRKAMDV